MRVEFFNGVINARTFGVDVFWKDLNISSRSLFYSRQQRAQYIEYLNERYGDRVETSEIQLAF